METRSYYSYIVGPCQESASDIMNIPLLSYQRYYISNFFAFEFTFITFDSAYGGCRWRLQKTGWYQAVVPGDFVWDWNDPDRLNQSV